MLRVGTSNQENADSQPSPLVPSSSPPLDPVENLHPLDSLHRKLSSADRAAKRLKQCLDEARNITEPSFFRAIFSAAPDQQLKTTLSQLLSQINLDQKLDTQLSQLAAAYQTLDEYLAVLVTQTKEKETEGRERIPALVEKVYQKLFRQFSDDCKQYAGILSKRNDALREYCDATRQVEKDCDWVMDDLRGANTLLNSVAQLNLESQQTLELFKGIQMDLPAGTRAVSVDVDGVEKRSHFDGVESAYLEFIDRVGRLRAVDLLALGKNIKQAHEKLNELKARYSEADEKYASLLKVYTAPTFLANRSALVSEINLLLAKEEREFTQNQDDIIAVIAEYLNDDNRHQQNARTALDQMFERRSVAVESSKEALEKLLIRTKNLAIKIETLEGDIAKLDQTYQSLHLLPRADRVSLFRLAEDAETCMTRLRQDLFLDQTAGYRAQLEAQTKQLEDIELQLPAFQKRIDSAYDAEKQLIEALLKLITTGDFQLDSSEERLTKISNDLPRAIEAITQVYDQARDGNNKIDSALGAIEEAKKRWNQFQIPKILDVRKSWEALCVKLLSVQKNESAKKDDDEVLKEIKEKWDDHVADQAVFSNWFTGVLPEFPEKSLFFTTLTDVEKSLSESYADVSSVSIYSEDKLVSDLRESYEKFIAKFNDVREFFRKIVPESDEQPQTLFDHVKEHANELTHAGSRFSSQVEARRNDFRRYYAGIKWQQRDLFSPEEVDKLKAYPAQLEKSLEELRAQSGCLFKLDDEQVDEENKKQQLEEQLAIKREVIRDFKRKFGNHLKELRKLTKSLGDYLVKFERYKEKERFFNNARACFTAIAGELGTRKITVAALTEDNATCQAIADGLQETNTKINKMRAELFSLVKTLNVSSEHQKIVDKLAAIDAEARFKREAIALFENVSIVKQRQAAINFNHGELLARLRHEFLFAGKSGAVIARLKAHRRQNHAQTAKGQLIDDFMQGLFDINSTGNLRALLNYLDRPFGANADHHHALFATSRFNFGRDSTTQQLISELREELLTLVERESEAGVGSITHAIQKDCEEIRREYNDILTKKDVGRASQSVRLAAECDALVAQAIALAQDDPVAIKLREDIMEVQRWAGADNASLACRSARMKCAIAIRQNDANSQTLFDQYKFSYSYQALKYHLENVTTKREADLIFLWRNLDRIAFEAGDENFKYDKMRKFMLLFFNHVRVDESSSFKGFFGRVGRLTKATEAFLLVDTAHRGLNYQLGDGAEEVRHAAEGGLFCCFRPN